MTQAASITGKAVVWAAFNTWLSTNIPGTGVFTYNFDQALDPATMPRVDVSEFKFFDPGDSALDGGLFGIGGNGGHSQGSAQRMVAEINIRTDGSQDNSALLLARQLRDQFFYALKNSGVVDDSGSPIMPPIIIYSVAGVATLVCRVITEVDNAIVENFFTTQPPETLIFRYQLLFRLEWFEMR